MPAVLLMIFTFAAVIYSWPQGWPFWPIFMTTAGLLTAWGVLIGQWRAPAFALGGYIAMRCVILGLAPEAHEVAAFLVWAVVAILLFRERAWIPSLAYLCSGAVYPFFLVLGFPIEYLGIAPIIAELFALCALTAMGGGLYGRMGSNSLGRGGHRGLGAFLVSASVGSSKSMDGDLRPFKVLG